MFGVRGVVALLLVASAAAFAVGREIERSEERRAEAAEIADGGAEEETGQEIAGLDSDAPELTVVGVVLSLLLAVGVFLRPRGWRCCGS